MQSADNTNNFSCWEDIIMHEEEPKLDDEFQTLMQKATTVSHSATDEDNCLSLCPIPEEYDVAQYFSNETTPQQQQPQQQQDHHQQQQQQQEDCDLEDDLCVYCAQDIIKGQGIYDMAAIKTGCMKLAVSEATFEKVRPRILEIVNEHLRTLVIQRAPAPPPQAVVPTNMLATSSTACQDMSFAVTQALAPIMETMTQGMVTMARGIAEGFTVRDKHAAQQEALTAKRFEEQSKRLEQMERMLQQLNRGVATASASVNRNIATREREQFFAKVDSSSRQNKHDIKISNLFITRAYLLGALHFVHIDATGRERIIIGNPKRLMEFDFIDFDMSRTALSKTHICDMMHTTLPTLQQRISEHPEWYYTDERTVDDEFRSNAANVTRAFTISSNPEDQVMAGMRSPADGDSCDANACPAALYPYAPLSTLLDMVEQNPDQIKCYVDVERLRTGLQRGKYRPITFKLNSANFMTKMVNVGLVHRTPINIQGLDDKLSVLYGVNFCDKTSDLKRLRTPPRAKRVDNCIYMQILKPCHIINMLVAAFKGPDPFLRITRAGDIEFDNFPGGYHSLIYTGCFDATKRPSFIRQAPISTTSSSSSSSYQEVDHETFADFMGNNTEAVRELVEYDDEDEEELILALTSPMSSTLGKRKATHLYNFRSNKIRK